MKFNRQIVFAVLLISICTPAVRADLVADPNEFKQLKKLTGVDKQNANNAKSGSVAPKKQDAKKTSSEKTTAKVTVKTAKTNGTASEKSSDKSKVKSSTTVTSEKSN